MPLVLRPPTDRFSLTGRLSALGQTRRAAMVARGVFLLVSSALAAICLACTLDATWPLPAILRAFLLVGSLSGIGILLIRGVLQAAREPVHPLSIALMLEERFPRLNDALASAVEFLNEDAREAGGSRFRRMSVARAEKLADRHNFEGIVPSGPAWRALWLMTCAAVVTATLGIADTGHAKYSILRFADPYGNHPWPTRTRISLDPTLPTRLARGNPYDIRFSVHGVIPDRATVSVRYPAGGATDEIVPLATSESNQTESMGAVRLEAGRVSRSFEFRVVANDAETGWQAVAVSPAPKLVPLDGRPSPQVSLEFPAYTDLLAANLPDGTGVIECVAGTRVTFRAAADQRVASALFRPQGDLAPAQMAAALAGLAGDNPLSAIGGRILAGDAIADVPVTVSGSDGTRLEARFTPRIAGLYALQLTGEDGLTGTRLFSIQVFPDPSPAVGMTRPDPLKDPLTLLPSASIPLETRAEDRTFAVRNLVLEYRIGTGPFRTLPLADLTATRETLPAVAGPAPLLALEKPVALDAARIVPLAALARSDGTPPADGDRITIRTVARDWDDYHVTKEPGRSKEIEIRVLGKASFDAMLQKELAALRPELLRLREEQRQTRESIDDLKKATAAAVPADAAGRLATAEQSQRQIRNQVADPTEGIRARAERLRQAIRANDLPRTPTTERVEAVAGELQRLTDQHLETAEPQVARARQEADKAGVGQKPDAKKLSELLTKARSTQRAAEASLDAILERLEQWGGASEVRGQAKNLKETIERLIESTKSETAKIPAKSAEELSTAEKAALAGAADKLDQTADQAAGLVAKATRLAAEKDAQAQGVKEAADGLRAEAKQADEEAAKLPPDSPQAEKLRTRAADLRNHAAALDRSADLAKVEAESLRRAIREAGGQAIPEDLRNAAGALRDNKPGNSTDAQKSAARRLDKLTAGLGEKPTESPDELLKKRKNSADELDALAAEQDELRKKVQAAAEEKDPAKREKELKKLAAEQEQLRRKTEQLLEKLTRDRADRSAESVRDAAAEMAAARDQLENGKAPGPQQDNALERFDEALQKLESEEKQARDDLSREKREQLADQLKALRDRQKAAESEAVRIGNAAVQAKAWTRPLLASLTDLEDREKNLAGEVRTFLEKNLAELPVFRKLAQQSADAMDRASRAASERKDDALADAGADLDPASERIAHQRILRPSRIALRRLDQILESLQEKPKPQTSQKPSDPKNPAGEPQPAPEAGPQHQPGIPNLAQLKALRAIQAEVNQTTAEFAKSHPDTTKLSDDEKDELKELEQTQREIAELFDQLAPTLRPGEPQP